MVRTSKNFSTPKYVKAVGGSSSGCPNVGGSRWFTSLRISAGRSEIRDTLMDAYVQKNPRYQPRYHICQEELQSS